MHSTCSKNMVKSSKNSAHKILIAESSHRTDKDLVLKQLTKKQHKVYNKDTIKEMKFFLWPK